MLRKPVYLNARVLALILVLISSKVTAQGGLDCNFTITNAWSSGAIAEIVVTNNSNEAVNIQDIIAYFNDPIRIQNLWNGNYSGTNPYTISGPSWQAVLHPGQSIAIGMQISNNGGIFEPPQLGGICTTAPDYPLLEISCTSPGNLVVNCSAPIPEGSSVVWEMEISNMGQKSLTNTSFAEITLFRPALLTRMGVCKLMRFHILYEVSGRSLRLLPKAMA